MTQKKQNEFQMLCQSKQGAMASKAHQNYAPESYMIHDLASIQLTGSHAGIDLRRNLT
jgi:hypothetical protein